ncbi:MAG TPA: Smr/MutS family protein [Taishania sp.]|nr:Smr/MutS family protein [Taishania sp.]
MHYKIGEKVVFLKEPGGGIIRNIKGNIIYVEDETGFDRPFTVEELGKVHGSNYVVSEEHIEQHKTVDIVKPKEEKRSKLLTKHPDFWEIDLHFDEIVDEFGSKLRLSKEQALAKQLAVFKKLYYDARDKKMRKLIVIHGFGKGILRDELQIFLKGQDGVDFFDAPYVEYGHGAIQVEIKYRY